MKILPVLPAPDGSAAPARTGTAAAMQWRRALEQAQWQARPRAGSGGETRAGARDAQAPGTDAHRTAGAARGGGVDEPGRDAASARTTSRGSSLAEPVVGALERSLALRGAAPDPRSQAPAAAPATVRASVATASSAEASAPGTLLPWSELPEWPDVFVHASAAGGRVSVGVRDARLSEADALALFWRLRSKLAHAGLELAGLTVNGHPVIPADAGGDHA